MKILNIFYFLIFALLSMPVLADEERLQFDDFPVTQVYMGSVAQPKLRSAEDHAYRTRLRWAMEGKPNFGGHYIVMTFGCGAGCLDGAVLDAITGKVTWFPSRIFLDDPNFFNPLSFQLDSSLIIFRGDWGEEEPNGEYYYNLKNGNFIKVAEVPLRGFYPHIIPDNP